MLALKVYLQGYLSRLISARKYHVLVSRVHPSEFYQSLPNIDIQLNHIIKVVLI